MKGRYGRSTERTSEETFDAILKALGLWTRHMENSAQAGFPDRYLGRGRWIEFKALLVTTKPRKKGKAIKTLLTKSQKRLIPQLLAAGDTVWVCVFIHYESGEPTRFAIGPHDEILALREKGLEDRSVLFQTARPETIEHVKKALGL